MSTGLSLVLLCLALALVVSAGISSTLPRRSRLPAPEPRPEGVESPLLRRPLRSRR